MPELKGKRLVMHEDNQSVIGVLTHLISKSPAMMSELRKLFHLTDEFDINTKTTYIRSAANIWADGLSRLKNNSDWRIKTSSFSRLDKNLGTVHRRPLRLVRKQTNPPINAKWGDGHAEAGDSLHLSDKDWREEMN